MPVPLDRAGYLAVALAFAGRFQQLYAEATSASAKQLYLSAATFAVDRTIPSPELNLRSRFRTTDDPIEFLVGQLDIVEPVPVAEWRSRPPALRKSALAPLLDAMDSLLKGSALPPRREGFIREWLEPFLTTTPVLRDGLEVQLGQSRSP